MEQSPFFQKLQKAGRECFPTCAAVEVTSRCNGRCSYCYMGDHVSEPEPSTSQLHFIIDKLDTSGIMFLNITGGEPFMRGDMHEIIEHCCTSGFFGVSLYSNGSLLTAREMSLLEKYASIIQPVRMTIFSHREEVHDAYIGIPGSLKKIVAASRELVSRGVLVQLALSCMDFNCDTLDETVAYFKELQVEVLLNFTKVIVAENDSITMRRLVSREFYDTLFEKNPQIRAIQKRYYQEGVKTASTPDALCRGLNENITIDANGDIHPCTLFRQFIIGSIYRDEPLNQILKSSNEYMALKRITKSELPCATCDHADICSPCLAQWHTLNNSLYVPHPQNCNFIGAIKSIVSETGNHHGTYCRSCS